MSNSERKPFELLRFLWKHKNEILGAAVCVAVSAYALYELGKQTSLNDEENHEEEIIIPITTTVSLQRQRQPAISIPDFRSRELSCIHTLFDKVIRILIPVIRTKVNDTIDVNSAIRKIKELQCEFKTEITVDDSGVEHRYDRTDMRITEAMLWDDVKVSSLTLLLTSIYLVSAVTVLLRVHLHMMGNKSMLDNPLDLHQQEQLVQMLLEGSYSNSPNLTHIRLTLTQTNPTKTTVLVCHTVFLLAVDRSPLFLLSLFPFTYSAPLIHSRHLPKPTPHPLLGYLLSLPAGHFKHFFDQGIPSLARDIQQQVVKAFAGWTVHEKVTRPLRTAIAIYTSTNSNCASSSNCLLFLL